MQDVRYDDQVGRALLASARRCFTNASATLDDAALLISNRRFDRGYALSILAQEEFSKCFLLGNCAAQQRWDVAVYKSLIQHEKKQALVQVMLQYIEWFQNHNAFALRLNASALIPAPISILPDPSKFQSWIAEANRSVVQGRSIDRAKQRALYVAVNKSGVVSSQPDRTKEHAEAELERARSFQQVTEIQLIHINGLGETPNNSFKPNPLRGSA